MKGSEENKYIPGKEAVKFISQQKIKFNGMHECYSINYKELKI
jgi:hypothetical protein